MEGERAPTIGDLLERVTYDADTYGGKSIIRGRRLAVEHVRVHLAVGDSPDALLDRRPRLAREDVLPCIAYAYRAVVNERFAPSHADRPA